MKKLTRAFILTAFILMALPALSLPFFKNQANTEKRELSSFPVLRTENGFNRNYTAELSDWVKDHVGFRSLMVSAKRRIRAELFGESAEGSVILGREGRLFYRETLKDFQNLPTLSARGAACAARSLKLLSDHAAEEGAVFVTAFIPNKNTLYPEFMPARYAAVGTENNYSLLKAALEKEGVLSAPVREALAAEPEILYQTTDSHWNYKGALIGYRSIMETAGLPHDTFDGLTFTARDDWRADLAEALYGNAAKPETQLYPDREFTYEITSHETAPDAIRLETFRAGGSGNALVYRDSFCNTMQKYFAESFENVLFSRAVPYRADYMSEVNADLVVLELTERNIGDLAMSAPVMAAPAAEISGRMDPVSGITARKEESGSYLHYFGTLPEEILGESYRVYLLAEEQGSYRAFEAFPIAEAERLGLTAPADNGWSIYLPEGTLAEDANLNIVIVTDGQNYIGAISG